MTNLYGRGKEPFWQQASTNLVKFVILLHLFGYTADEMGGRSIRTIIP